MAFWKGAGKLLVNGRSRQLGKFGAIPDIYLAKTWLDSFIGFWGIAGFGLNTETW